MADTVARISGVVLGIEERSGISERSGTPKAWKMRTAKVLMGDDVVKVTLSDSVVQPARGELVDWFVSVRFQGQYMNIDLRSEWSAVPDADL